MSTDNSFTSSIQKRTLVKGTGLHYNSRRYSVECRNTIQRIMVSGCKNPDCTVDEIRWGSIQRMETQVCSERYPKGGTF